MAKRVVVKLSGSLFDKSTGPRVIKDFSSFFKDLASEGVELVLVAGGGRVARDYISRARALGGDESSLDEIGIQASRLNARLLITAMAPYCYSSVPTSLEEVLKATHTGRVVIAGGLHPGHSTNAVSALIAEATRSNLLVNSTDVDAVYSEDPKKSRKAKRLSRVSVKELISMLSEGEMVAGSYELMDIVSLKIIERSRIPTRVVKCGVKEIRVAIKGKDVGTLITP